MGGADTVVAKARKSFEDGDYRWAAEVLNHVIFAQPDHAEALALQADTFEKLASPPRAGRGQFLPLRRDGVAQRQLRHAHRSQRGKT